MAGPNLRYIMVFEAAAIVVALLLAAQCTNAEVTTANLNLRDCDPDGDWYYNKPSPANCPTVKLTIPKGRKVSIYCKTVGSVVKGDTWWLYVYYGATAGFVADYYVDCGGVVCRVPDCNNPLFVST